MILLVFDSSDSSESGRLMIPARDGAARGVVGPGVAGHGVGPADGHGDAPGRSPDGRAIASPPVAAA